MMGMGMMQSLAKARGVRPMGPQQGMGPMGGMQGQPPQGMGPSQGGGMGMDAMMKQKVMQAIMAQIMGAAARGGR